MRKYIELVEELLSEFTDEEEFPEPFNIVIMKTINGQRQLAHKLDNQSLSQLMETFHVYRAQPREPTQKCWNSKPTRENGQVVTFQFYVVMQDGTPISADQISKINDMITTKYASDYLA